MTSLLGVSELVGSPVSDASGRQIGTAEDLVARFAEEGYPPVTGVVVTNGGASSFVPTQRLASLGPGSIVTTVDRQQLGPFERRPGEVLLRRDVLGRQLIHIDSNHRARLVHAGEIDLAEMDGWWRVAGVDAVRRGWLPWRRRADVDHSAFVDWTSLDAFMRHVPTSRLRLRSRRLAQLHPGEIADLVESASPSEGQEIIEALGEDKALEADVFEELDQEHRLEMLANRSDVEVANLLSRMEPDDAVDLLSDIDQSRRQSVLAAMTPEQEKRLRKLLDYNPNTAGGLMSPRFVCLPPTTTAAAALEILRRDELTADLLDTIFTCPALDRPPDTDGRVEGSRGVDTSGVGLAGSVRIRDLLRADPGALLSELADPDPPSVTTSADVPEIALTMADYNLVSLAVVDQHGHLSGVVTVDDLLDHLIPQGWRRRAEALGD
ncbi:MAG: CBS domain-containing protein [Actinomycetota bacterium]|nr:CBS domain-containing protein [Actinomycetota bacterium]